MNLNLAGRHNKWWWQMKLRPPLNDDDDGEGKFDVQLQSHAIMRGNGSTEKQCKKRTGCCNI